MLRRALVIAAAFFAFTTVALAQNGATYAPNTVLAGPPTGSSRAFPVPRSLVAADFTAVLATNPTFTMASGSSSDVVFSSSNTGQQNQFWVSNAGTASNSGTLAEFLANIGGSTGSDYINMAAVGGATPQGVISVGSGMTGGLYITTNGNGTLTLVQPQMTFGTGGTSAIVATSANTGNISTFNIQNSGVISNTGTIANFVLGIGTGTGFLQAYVAGGATPNANLVSGSALTAGFNISATAGALSLSGATTVLVTSNATFDGNISVVGAETVLSGTAPPSGGTAGDGYVFSSTANFGLFFGTGAPTLAAAEGSLYLRNDNGALYQNTNGSTAWSQIVSGSGCTVSGVTTGYVYNSGSSSCLTSATLTVAGSVDTESGQFSFTRAATIASSAGAVLDTLNMAGETTTISGSTNITTAAGFNLVSLYRPTYTSASPLTITAAATLYIANCPLASGSITITSCWALNVGSGPSNFGGAVTLQTPATTAQIWAATAGPALDSGTVFNAAGVQQSLSGTTSVTPNFSLGFNFTFTATSADNFTLQNPSNIKAGQMGSIQITQPGSGTVVTIAFGSDWQFAGGTTPALTATLSAVDMIYYYCPTTSVCIAAMANNIKT